MKQWKKQLKIPILLLVLCVVLEIILFGYKIVLHKGFKALHLVENMPIEIAKEEIKIDDTSSTEYTYINVKKSIKEVYNVTLKLKEKNQDTYIRIVGNIDKLMEKSNKEQNSFKAYFNKPMNFEEIQIAYPKTQIAEENIEKIVINENVDYLPEAKIDLKELAIIIGSVMGIYLVVQIYIGLAKGDRTVKWEKAFLSISLIMGILMSIVTAPLAKYDEHAHFWRTYEIADGNLISDIRNEFPKSVEKMIIDEEGIYHIKDINYDSTREKFQYKLEPEEKVPLAVGATAGNSPLSYLPPLISTFIGIQLELKPIIMVYLGRICNVIAYSLLIYFSIRLMPKKKWKQMIGVIGLFPMCINLAASYSPDTTIIAVAIFMLSYVLHLKFGERQVNVKDGIILGLSTVVLMMCKIVYAPMILLFFLLPKNKFKNKKIRNIIFAFMIAIVILGNGIWKLVPRGAGATGVSTSATEQLYYTVADPMRTLGTFVNTIITLTPQYLMEMVGGWNTPEIISVILLAFLVIIIMNEEEKEDKIKLEKKDKIVLGIIAILEIILIFAGLYITWSRAHESIITGVQGRYFLPVLPLITLLLSQKKVKINVKNKEAKLLFIIILLYIPVIIKTIQAFL